MSRIAIVGTGIAGMTAAWHLHRHHDLTVFEANDYVGGHTATVDVERHGRRYAVDTGFIVFNDWTYPNFIDLLEAVGASWQWSDMSFSLRCERTGLEYNGADLDRLFVQRRNLLRPSHWGMIRDILRFHRDALALRGSEMPLGDVLARGRYGRAFRERYLVPMMAAIWSAEPQKLMAMPARFFVAFFENHGMLTVDDRPQWFTVVGGSRSYLGPLVASFRDRVRLGAPVARLERTADGVRATVRGQPPERFDGAVVAAHSDQALAMLGDADDAERATLGAIPYQENDVVLHTDASLLPRRKKAWAAWNYHLPAQPAARATVTYCMNLLQGLPGDVIYNVTLNRSDAIDPAKVLRRFVYHHPVFDAAGVRAQERVQDLNGRRRVWWCGAWCGFGFHEDGVQAGLRVAADFGLGDAAVTAGAMAGATA
ncbi:MAG: NAD(P)/FAD-dependent oxidoreductase [Gammaproteobacteria bacterium]